jgi:polyisoprenoid-binding protein YceI
MVQTFKNPLRYLIPILLSAAVATAQETVVEFDPGRTKVEFTLADVLHTVKGTFKLKAGKMHFDPSTGAAGGSLIIDARSGDSGSSARDGRMHKNILESQKYPDITFTVQRVDGRVAAEGDSQVEVEGTFNIHGADHPLKLAAKVGVKDAQITASMHFVVPYAQWGMKNPSTFILRVSDKVDIDIQARGRVVGGKL